MKIAVVFDGLQVGGIEKVGSDYCRIFNDLGHEVTVINLVPKKNTMLRKYPKNITYIPFSFERNIVSSRYRKYIDKNIFYRTVARILIKYLDIITSNKIKQFRSKYSEPYDIAIAFSGHYNDLEFITKGFIKTNKRIAWLHGSQYDYFEISKAYYDIYKHIRNLVCLSNHNDERVLKYNEEHKINKKKIYNPIRINKNSINQEKVKKLKNKYGDYCLMVARMTKEKDHETVIKAIKYLNDKYGTNKNVIFVGDGKNRANLEKLSKKYGVSNNVVFEGERNDTENYYSSASIYVHSSPFEGLPTVLLEAMSYNLPIVATNSVPGVEEILQDKCGLISDVGDYKTLAENIYKVMNDSKLKERLIQNSNKRLDDFSYDRIKNEIRVYLEGLQ